MYHLTELKNLIKKHDLKIQGIIQVGASMGEEIEQFQNAGITQALLIDANPLSLPELRRKVEETPYQAVSAAVWSSDKQILKFKIMDFLACSTLQTPAFTDLSLVKEIDVETITLNTLLKKLELDPTEYNMLYIDCEGSELEVLKGLDLSKIDYVYSEFQTNLPNTPANLTKALEGFVEVERVTNLHKDARAGEWGDILFKRI